MIFPLGFGTALSLFGDTTLYTVLPTNTDQAGIMLGSVGLILSVNRFIRLLLNSPFGKIYDRYSRRRLFVPSLFIGAVSTFLYATNAGFWPLLIGRLLWGLAWSGIWVGGATIILDVTNDQDRGRWSGMYQTWFFLGAGLGAAIGGTLTDWIGYQSTMLIAAIVTAIGGVVAWCLLPETRGEQLESSESQSFKYAWKWYSDARIWVAIVLQWMNRFVFAGVLAATMALLVSDFLKLNNLLLGVGTVTGLLMAGRTLFSTLAAPIAGTLSDRVGDRWLVMLATTLLGVVGMLLLSGDRVVGLTLGVLIGSAASGGLQTITTALMGDRAGREKRGQAIGILHTGGDLGSALGPITAYLLLPMIGLAAIYWLCAGLLLIGGLWVLAARSILISRS